MHNIKENQERQQNMSPKFKPLSIQEAQLDYAEQVARQTEQREFNDFFKQVMQKRQTIIINDSVEIKKLFGEAILKMSHLEYTTVIENEKVV